MIKKILLVSSIIAINSFNSLPSCNTGEVLAQNKEKLINKLIEYKEDQCFKLKEDVRDLIITLKYLYASACYECKHVHRDCRQLLRKAKKDLKICCCL